MKKLIIVVATSTVVAGSGVAAATMLSARSSTPSPEKRESDEAGINGGPISRFHGASECNLVDVSTLPGNWTHGDYVSTVEGLGDASMVPVAAHSDCGKPMVAVGNKHGPPDFVIKQKKAHQPESAEPADTPGS